MANTKKKIPKTATKKETIAVKTENNKKAIVVELKKTPIVQIACQRVGVARSSYYRWRADDTIFARAADRAIESGKFLINDLAESKLIQHIDSGNLTAIIFWLKYNHPSYSKRYIHEYDLVCDKMSTEEEHQTTKMFNSILAGRMTKFTPQEIEEEFKLEEIEERKRENMRKKLKKYDAD